MTSKKQLLTIIHNIVKKDKDEICIATEYYINNNIIQDSFVFKYTDDKKFIFQYKEDEESDKQLEYSELSDYVLDEILNIMNQFDVNWNDLEKELFRQET